MSKARLTHKGWFGFAPVYIAGDETTDEQVVLTSRFVGLGWLVDVNAWIFDRCADIMEFLGQDPGGYPVNITGELPKSEQKWMEVEE